MKSCWMICMSDLLLIEIIKLLRYFHVVKNTHYYIHLNNRTCNSIIDKCFNCNGRKAALGMANKHTKMFNLIFKWHSSWTKVAV